MKYDLVIKNGRVIDPSQNMDCVTDIGIIGEKVAFVGEIDAAIDNVSVLNADGCIVTPGLIDMHCHMHPFSEKGIWAEPACFTSGVTTAAEGGSLGCSTFEKVRVYSSTIGKLRIKHFLSCSSLGQGTASHQEQMNPDFFNGEKINYLYEKYPDEIVGVKIRQSKKVVGSYGLNPLRRVIDITNEQHIPVMIHCSDPAEGMPQLLNLMRKGDILTHAFNNKGDCLVKNGKIIPEAIAARERGVIFDIGHAIGHLSFDTYHVAASEGFMPDTISSDLTRGSLYRKPEVFNLAFILSEFYCLGMPLNDVIEKATAAPAKVLGMEGKIGTLRIGSCADIAVFKMLEREVVFGDCDKKQFVGNHLLRNVVTVKDGDIVFKDIEF